MHLQRILKLNLTLQKIKLQGSALPVFLPKKLVGAGSYDTALHPLEK
ncbi:hypothetical protein LEP1GSC133_1173 [Leptospira borgpetersenii serovar Pomona str. 200901868]|uniref:Uncharacterized protein n=1 Tax=Leptospira borgpetersenii serovar Pomona str. 200901868 TaxID=1192866 RepID=M6WAY9_LEPBO|nr:hypothetical protein LEP1GSC133_1173 [Leptospira borgpetersenii serovar Pomona str. 200901868]